MQWNDNFLNSSSMMMVTLKKVVTGVWFHRLAGCHRVTYDDSLLVDYSHPPHPPGGLLKAGLFSRLSNKAGANLVTTLQSHLCNMPSCHMGTSQTPTPKAVFLSVSFSPKSHTGPLQRRWVPFVFSLSELDFWRQWTHNQPCLRVALNAMVRLAILEEPTYAACLIFSLKSHHPNLGEHNSCLWFQN